jgi:putative molybdopterin biosynthesis protein
MVQAGVRPGDVAGYDRVVSTHMAAAGAVASGGADAAVSLAASARILGLEFLPLEEMRFDFVIPRAHLTHPGVGRLLDALHDASLRADVGSVPGYEVSGMWTIHLDVPAEAARPAGSRRRTLRGDEAL